MISKLFILIKIWVHIKPIRKSEKSERGILEEKKIENGKRGKWSKNRENQGERERDKDREKTWRGGWREMGREKGKKREKEEKKREQISNKEEVT